MFFASFTSYPTGLHENFSSSRPRWTDCEAETVRLARNETQFHGITNTTTTTTKTCYPPHTHLENPSRPTPRHRRRSNATSTNIHQPLDAALGLPHRHPPIQVLGRVQAAETRVRAASRENIHGSRLGRGGRRHQRGRDFAQSLCAAWANERRGLRDGAVGVRGYRGTRVVDGGCCACAELECLGLRGAWGGRGRDDVGNVGLRRPRDGADNVGHDVGDADGDADGGCCYGFRGDEAVDGGIVGSCVGFC